MKYAIVLCLAWLMLFPNITWGADLSCQLSRGKVEVGLDPAKETITVFGQAPVGAPVLIKIEGPDRPELVSLYQKHALIKFSEVEVMALPGLYQILTSQPLEQIPSKYLVAAGVSPEYSQLRANAWVKMRQDTGENYHKNYQDYISLALKKKEERNLYQVRQAVVNREGENYWVEFPLIQGMPIGEIKVTAMTVFNNQLLTSEPQLLMLQPYSFLSLGSQDLSISGVLVISLFMVPIIMLTIAQIWEALEQRRLRQKRANLLRQIT